jgi:hypothetical protein
MPVIEPDLIARQFALISAENEALRDALSSIKQLIPPDCHDWQVHGVHSSDIYVRIEQVITLALAVKRLPL